MTANAFGVRQCTVSKTLLSVGEAINEILAPMEWHKLEEANMAEQPDPLYSSNTREGEYIRGVITEYINHNLDLS